MHRKPDESVAFNIVFPETQEANLLRKEGEIEAELGAAKQVTPFLSETEVAGRYKSLRFTDENFPSIAEHLLRAVAPSIYNPELYVDTEEIQSAPDNPLVPFYQGGRLKHRVVRTTVPSEAMVYGRDRRRVGERVVMGEAHQTADDDQIFKVEDQGIPYGERFAPTEHESYHYYWRETPDVEVRLSPSGKYLSAVVPDGFKVDLPTSFPLNIYIQQSWEEFEQRGSGPESLYEFLSTNPHLFRIVDEEGQVVSGMPSGDVAPTVGNLPEYIYRAVYGSMPVADAEADWELVRQFMGRARESQNTGITHSAAEVDAARRFALRLPAPPNILTQVRRYLTAVHKAIKRSDPVVDSLVALPQFTDYEPHVLNAGQLSETTNQMMGTTDETDVDVEIEGGEAVLAQQIEQEELENVEAEESADTEMDEAVAAADEETETPEEPSEVEQEMMDLARDAGSAGIPFPSEIEEHYQMDWFERYQTVANTPENGVDVLWQDGTLRVRRDITQLNQDGRWVSTGEQQAAGLETMVSQVRRSLRNLIRAGQLPKEGLVRVNGIRERLQAFTQNGNFDHLSLWSENGDSLKALLNTLSDAHNAFTRYGGLRHFNLKGHLLTSLPVGRLEGRTTALYTDPGRSRRLDVIVTNTGKMIPIDSMQRYVADPATKDVLMRPPTQLSMIVDAMQETNPETGETTTLTRFFADHDRHGQSYEVINESDTALEASVVGTGYTLRFDKTSGEVVMSYPNTGWRSRPVFITDWQNVPLNTTNETRRALAPIAMSVKHGFFPNTGGVPLQLYHISMADEGRWDYRLNAPTTFDLGADGVVTASNYQFVVSVVPSQFGFIYQVESYQGAGDEAMNANVFRTPEGDPTHLVHVFMQKNGVTRAPHEAILEMMWQQREAAIEQGWRLPEGSEAPEAPVTQEIDYERPPEIGDWEAAGTNPNDVYFESWERWSSEIEQGFGSEVINLIERSVFQSSLPIHTRSHVWVELSQIIAEVTEDGSEAQGRLRRLLEMATPGLLREHLNAQDAFTPTDPKFAEVDADSPVIRKYRHADFDNYSLEMLEGRGIADVRYEGEVVGSVDYTEAENMWEAVGRDFHSVVREHSARRQANQNYDMQTLESGDVAWTAEDGQTRILFDAELPTVVGQTLVNGEWVAVEASRHQLPSSFANEAVYKQFQYLTRIEKQLVEAEEEAEHAEAMKPERGQPRAIEPVVVASYTGPVRELPPDADDYQKYLGADAPSVPQIRRFTQTGNPIEVHLLMPDRHYSPQTEEGKAGMSIDAQCSSTQTLDNMSVETQ